MARIIGDGIVLPKDSILAALKDKSRHANVPIILGVNKDENKTFNLFDDELVTNIFNLTFNGVVGQFKFIYIAIALLFFMLMPFLNETVGNTTIHFYWLILYLFRKTSIIYFYQLPFIAVLGPLEVV